MQRSHIQKLATGSVVVLLFSFLSSPLGYLMRLVFARVLSIQDYGTLYSVIGFFWFFITFNDLGLGYSVSYFVPKFFKKKQYDKVWHAFIYDLVLEIFTAILVSSLIIWNADWLASNYLKVTDAGLLLKIFSIYLVMNSTSSALRKIFNGLQQESYYSSMEFTRISFTLVVSAISWYVGITNVYWYGFVWCIAYAVITLVYGYLFTLKNWFLVRVPVLDKELLRSMFQFALPTLFIQTISTFIDYADTIFLTLFRGVVSVGIYNIIFPIASIPTLLLAPLNLLITPYFSFHIDEKEHKLEQVVTFFLKLLPFFGLYIAVFIMLYPTSVVTLLFGGKWRSLPALSLQILSFGFCFQLIALFFVAVVNGLGKVRQRLRASLFLAVFAILASSLGAYFFDVTGVALSNSLVYFFSSIFFGKIIYDQLTFAIPFQFYGKMFCTFIVIAGIMHFFWSSFESILSLLTAGVVYSLMVVSVGYLFFNVELQKIVQELWIERKKNDHPILPYNKNTVSV